MTDAVDIRCPKCNRWLAEAASYGRAVCYICGWEIEIRDKEKRKADGRGNLAESEAAHRANLGSVR